MASEEVLVKITADLTDLKSGFSDQSDIIAKHNKDVAEGEKAYKKYGETVVKANEAVNKKLQENIKRISEEGKAVEKLQKDFQSLNKANKDSFDAKNLETFEVALEKVSNTMGSLESLNLNVDDFDRLLTILSATEDDFETLNALVGFFEDKMKQTASSVTDSFETVKVKIEETKLNIQDTEQFIKDINKQIDATAPGQTQANLISEREAATQALNEEKIALADYQTQLKKAREENVSMATQLRKVKDELIQLEIAGETNTERYRKLTEEAETYNDAIAKTNAQLKRQASNTEGLDQLIGAVNGIVGVYSAAEGAAALFGDESEDLQKTLIKLNGAIALLNGLQSIQTELAKKETIAARALTFVRGQYAVATDASTKATLRLSAATKLLGIGLLVGALAAIVVYWEDIAKAIGLVNVEAEALEDINKKTIESIGTQIGSLKSLEAELKNSNTTQQRQKDIKRELLEQYPSYLKALGDEKSSAEDIETAFNNLNKALLLNAKITAARELLSDEFKKVLEAERKAIEGEASTYQTVINSLKNINFNPEKAEAGFNADNLKDSQENLKQAQNDYEDFETFIIDFVANANKELEELGGDPTKDGENLKAAQKAYESYYAVLKKLVDEQENYRINSIENNREREKEILRERLNDEKENYKREIDELNISEAKKLKLREEYDKLYNEQTGAAYELLRKDLLAIDEKYISERKKLELKAQQAIDSVFKSEAENDRLAIQEKYQIIRDEILEQVKQTNSDTEKTNLLIRLDVLNAAEENDLSDFDLNTDLDRVDREKDIAESILAIQQSNIRETIKNEKLKQLQLLNLDKAYLNQVLQTYENSFNNLEDKSLFDELSQQLINSVDPEEIQDISDKLREAFGDDVAEEILKTVEALKFVGNEINKIGDNSKFEDLIDDFSDWTNSLESFARKLAETLGLQGGDADEFAKAIVTAISTTYDSLKTIFDAEVNEYRNRVNTIQESIDSVEDELERERQLYEDGYANNYEARQDDLENLKEQKRKEEEELKKAQKRRAALAKAELLIDTVSQLSNLITASSSIFKWASKIPIIGVPLAIGLIGTMFGAFAVAKTKAFQAIGQSENFRTGLAKGKVGLHGPTHERGGFGLYNSETGDKVAEFEGREHLYVLNDTQQSKFGRTMQAMIEDEKGGKNFRDSVFDIFSIPKMGSTTTRVVERVNTKIVESQKAKQEYSQETDRILNEVAKLRIDFKQEFKGYKDERKAHVKTWETPKYYWVKIGSITKKYPKNEG